MISKSSLRRSRAGFTMIELLVVIAIIVLLVGLTTSAVMQFRQTGPKLATKSNIQNMKAALDTQWQAVRDKAQRENIILANVPPLGFSLADPRARAAYVQLKLNQAFPVLFDEIMNDGLANGRLAAWPAYKTYLSSLGVSPTNATTVAASEVQQAICLLMILEKGPSNAGSINQASLGSTGAKQLVLRNGQTAWGCVDAFDSRPEAVVGNAIEQNLPVPACPQPTPVPNPPFAFQMQPAGPLLFTRTVGGKLQSPGILSAGPDTLYGVDFTTFAPVPLPPSARPNLDTDNIHAP